LDKDKKDLEELMTLCMYKYTPLPKEAKADVSCDNCNGKLNHCIYYTNPHDNPNVYKYK
jgi:hypothetical protein